MCEKRLTGRITADAYDPGTNTAFFIDGCFWHACEDCNKKYGNIRHPVRKQFTYREIREQDYARNRYVEAAGYSIIIKKECQIASELDNNSFMKVGKVGVF